MPTVPTLGILGTFEQGMDLRKCCLLFTLLSAIGPGCTSSAQDGYPRIQSLDILHYRIRITVSDTSPTIRARTEIVACVWSNTLHALPFDFCGLTVDSVSINGDAAPYRQDSAHVVVSLPPVRHREDTLVIALTYHGQPLDGLNIRPTKFGDPSVFADNWPDRARYWFPAVDHPYDKATVECIVTAPLRFDVVGNGRLQQVVVLPENRKLWHWSETVSIPTYCMVFGAAEFSTTYEGSVKGTPIFHYLYTRDREKASRDYGRTAEILTVFNRLIGPYPYEKLALVESSTMYGGMENASAIFLDEHAIGKGRNLEGLSAHEIAHQWFGNSVTEADWNHLWLSEGFAEYFEKLFVEATAGKEIFRSAMRSAQNAYLKYDSAGTATLVPQTAVPPHDFLTPVPYQKGASVLHMLRHEMGDSAFFRGIRDYVARFRNRTVLTGDFQDAMEKQDGRSLEWFFHQWTASPGFPVLEIQWSWDEGGGTVRLHVAQKQHGILFRIPLDVETAGKYSTARTTFSLRKREESLTIPLPAKPERITIDPDGWMLQVVHVRSTP
jgi:aminopeptidase N